MSDTAAFAHALLDPLQPVPHGLVTHNGSDPAARFAVYRNNVVASLTRALADAYPVTRQLVGDEFFDAMARLYLRADPPSSPVLVEYGAAWPAFVERFGPASPLPWLADVARLERARVRAFHAADARPLDADLIAARLAQPDRLAGARLAFHPCAQVLVSPYAIVSLWAAHQGRGDLAQVDPCRPEAALVLREDDDAAVVPLPPATAVFFRRLQEGATLAWSAADAGAAGDAGRPGAEGGPPFDLAASLAILIRHRILIAWHAPLEPAS